MESAGLLAQLALVLALSSLFSALLRRLRLPGALGYLLCGWVAGTHGPVAGLVAAKSLDGMAELGIILLFFTMGVEFQPSRLREAGLAVVVAALSGIATMVAAGSWMGRLFGWGRIDSLFLGSLLAISSTVMVTRTLREGKHMQKPFARFAQAILVAEDILAVALLAILSGVASGKGASALAIAGTFGKMGALLAVVGGIGLLLLPRILGWIVRSAGEEAMLLASLAIAFGFCLLMESVGFSSALGAFLAGALLAGSPLAIALASRVEPLRDLFSALFFVSMGMLVDPAMIGRQWSMVVCGALLVLLLKPLACTAGAVLAGQSVRLAFRTGLSLGQIGEFSLVIAALGASLGVTRPELHAVAIGVTLATALCSPFLLARHGRLMEIGLSATPQVVRQGLSSYLEWASGKSGLSWRRMGAQMVRRLLTQVAVNAALTGGIFFAASFLPLAGMGLARHGTLLWSGALVISLPFSVAIYRKLRALGMILGEIAFPLQPGRKGDAPRRILREIAPVFGLVPIYLWVLALSGDLVPSLATQGLGVAASVLLSTWLWKPLTRIQSRLKAAWSDALG
jgi:CPA2 family monovalent cation:H+ antiporter-2